jgi:DNA polymerase-4
MRARIRAAFSPALRCSIGLAPNAYLAKVASEIVKPDGLVRIDEDNLPAVLLPLALEALPGIGRHMRRRLARCGIHTMEQLWAQPCGRLRAIWGGLEGERFWLRLRGHEVPLPPTRRATFGHSHVLPPDLREWGKARAVCIRLLQKAAMRLRMAAYHAARLDVSVQTAGARWEEWEAFDPACSTQVFITAFGRAWERRPALPRPVAVAVALSGLTPSAGLARPLFAHDRDARREQLDRAMDALNLQLGARTVYYGGAWGALHSAPTRIAFAQIPDMRL